MSDTAIVTGGTGGLGVAVVEALLARGTRVVVPWIAERELARLPERDGLELVQADLFDQDAVREVVDLGASRGDLRWVANLVGGFASGQPVAETPIDAFEEQMRLNLRPTYLMTAAAFPRLVDGGGGAIVCVSSRAALRPFAGAAGYCASKAAVATFAAVVAEEGKKSGVRCNAILPSMIDTPANREAIGPDTEMVPPAEIASVVAFLLSEASAPTSGSAVPVYGKA